MKRSDPPLLYCFRLNKLSKPAAYYRRRPQAFKKNPSRHLSFAKTSQLLISLAFYGSVAKNILATFHSSNEQILTATSCMINEFLQQSRNFSLTRRPRSENLISRGSSRKVIPSR